MNFALTDEQARILESVEGTLRRAGEASTGLEDPKIYLDALADGGFLDIAREAGPLEATLIIEAAARLGIAAPMGPRLLVGPLCTDQALPPMVGLMTGRDGLVRFGGDCTVFLTLDHGEAYLVPAESARVERLHAPVGYPMANVSLPDRGERLGAGAGDRLRRGWHIALAAEAAGCMTAAVTLTAAYVSDRYQFGRPIGSFQAVQHRLARAHTLASSALWLARRAAWQADSDYLAACAAAQAAVAADEVFTDTHQVTGAMGITSEHGLVAFTQRLVALQREFGGTTSHAQYVTLARMRSTPWSEALHA